MFSWAVVTVTVGPEPVVGWSEEKMVTVDKNGGRVWIRLEYLNKINYFCVVSS